MTGPQDYAPMAKDMDDTFMVDNIEVSMATMDINLDNFEDTFVSTQEVESLYIRKKIY